MKTPTVGGILVVTGGSAKRIKRREGNVISTRWARVAGVLTGVCGLRSSSLRESGLSREGLGGALNAKETVGGERTIDIKKEGQSRGCAWNTVSS